MLEFSHCSNSVVGRRAQLRRTSNLEQKDPLPVPLSTPAVAREPYHTRRIEFNAYRRSDALWDLELRLLDVKPYDCPLESGIRPAGVPMHDMWIRLTVDGDYKVVDAEVVMDGMPYEGFCDRITPEYKKLIGLSLRFNFRMQVAQIFRGTAGCTHLTEMLALFPTAAVQSMFEKPLDTETKPFQLDRCHALNTSGEAVRRYYPRWVRHAASATRKV